MASNSDFDWVIEPWLAQPRGFRGQHSDEAEQARQEAIENLEHLIRAGMMMSLQMRGDTGSPEHVEAFAASRALLEISREHATRNIAKFRELAQIAPEPPDFCPEWKSMH
jgi:hypothetical protein